MWDGKRILDDDWVAAATSTQVANPDEGNPDWSQGYGFQFWMARHGFRGDGAYGQFCVILPEQDVVLALTGQSLDMQAVLDAAWQHLLPAVDGASATGADTALEARLASLGLPAVEGGPLHGLADVGPLARDGDGWRLTLDVDGGTLSVPVGQGEWTVEGPLAASGAVADDGTVRVDVRFVETPHLAHVRIDPATGSTTTSWQTEPLHDGPLTLRRPAD